MVAFKRYIVEVNFFVDAASEEDAERLVTAELRSRGVALQRTVAWSAPFEDEEAPPAAGGDARPDPRTHPDYWTE